MRDWDNHVLDQLKQELEQVNNRQDSVTSHNLRVNRRSIFNIGNIIFCCLSIVGISLWISTPNLTLAAAYSDRFPSVFDVFKQTHTYYALGSILILASVGAVPFRVRQFYSRSDNWKSVCPGCQTNQLVQLHRTRSQRMVGWVLRLPFRHYRCAVCKWQGMRIDHALL